MSLIKKKANDNITNRAIKYQIFPTPEQASQMARTFGCARLVYNLGIEMLDGLYAAGFGYMGYMSLNNYCTRVWKAEMPFLKEVDKFALNNSLMNLDVGYQRLFEKASGHPKCKSRKDSEQSYTTNMTNGNIKLVLPSKKGSKGKIQLPKLGLVDACIYRLPKKDWVIKQATVSKDCRGKYWASILFAFEEPEVQPVVPTLEKTLGLDYSSPHFFVASDGNVADMPHYYRMAESRLAKEQRKLSHMEKGSNNYQKQKTRVAKLHGTVANQRRDFNHKLSRKIANSYDAVCVEDIDLRALAGALSFGKATLDNGFGQFRTFLKYKLEEQGKYYVVIDKWYPSTKTCHDCGGYNPDVVLGQMEWVCPHCGAVIQRDDNAALNIRDKGFSDLMEQLRAA